MVSPAGQYVHNIEELGFRWQEWKVGRKTINPFGEFNNFLELFRIFKRENPDLVHLHTIKPVLYGSLAALLAGLKVVVRSVTGRGYVFLGVDLRARLLRPLVKGVYRFLLRTGHGVTVFENQADKRYFEEQGLVNKEKSFLIEGVGVDTEYFSPKPEPGFPPVVLMAGRLLWDKGVNTFVEAAHIIRQNINARFVLVGEPDPGNPASIDEAVINDWVKDDLIEWWGWKADMREVFAACQLVALPSLGEGIPTILLEAAACGRPVVATDVPGCREVVYDGVNGFLVPVRDAKALSVAFEKLLVNKQLRIMMGMEGRRIVEERFSDKQINKQTSQLYFKLLESH